MDFPDYFPSDCPPQAAIAAAGIVFRFVKADPPTAADFLSYFELGKTLSDKRLEYQFCGLSVYAAGVLQAQAMVPGMRKRKVAKGRLGSEWGRLMNTPGAISEHHTWWLPKGSRGIEQLFVVVSILI
jgi:hypothetical protein